MEFKVSHTYQFSNHHNLKPELRGCKFTPIHIEDTFIRIRVFKPDGSILHCDNLDYWTADAPSSYRWDYFLLVPITSWSDSKLKFNFIHN